MTCARLRAAGVTAMAIHVLLVPSLTAQNVIDTTLPFPPGTLQQVGPLTAAFDVAQDAHGVLWVGTNEGLARLDGLAVESFRHDPARPASLSHDTVRKIVVDRSGSVWVRTGVGLDRYDPQGGLFRHYPLVVDYVLEDGRGRILVASAAEVLQHDPSTDHFVRVARLLPVEGAARTDEVWGGWASADGSSWWSTADGTLYRIGTDASVTATSLGVRDAVVLTGDERGHLWIGHRAGLAVYDPISRRLVDHRPFRSVTGPILVSYRAGDGRTFVAGTGLYQVSADAAIVTTVPLGPDPLTTPIRAVLIDREGLLWLATPRGLRVHNPYAKQWVQVTSPGTTVMAVEHSPRRVWLGTLDAGVWGLSDAVNEAVAPPSTDRPTPCGTRVWSLLGGANAEMWVGSDQGVCRWTPSGVVAVSLPVTAPATAPPAAFVLKRDETGTVWAGTTAGLYRVPPGTLAAERIDGVGDERDGRINVEGLLPTQQGVVWVGTSRSDLHRVDTRSKKSEYFPLGDAPVFKGSEGFWSLAEVGDGRLWLGSDRGLFLFDPSDASLEPIDDTRGVPRMPIYAILRDDQGSLWFSTPNGLWRHDNPLTATRSSALVRHYTTNDGLPFAEFNRRAAAIGPDGWLAFGGMGGVVRFHPASFRDNPHPPPVHVLAVERTRFDGPPQPAIVRDGIATLSHGDAGFVVAFAALTFSDAHRAVLHYRMEDVDPDWIVAGSDRRARYSALPPGRYTFRVRAANADRVWNLEGAAVTLVVPAPWWGTLWFRAIAAVVFVVALGVVLRQVTTRRLRRRVQALELDQRVLTERERISRDLHDHVGAQVTTMLAAIELTDLTAARGDLAGVQSSLADLRDDAQRTMTQLRETVWSLRRDQVTVADLAGQIRDDLAARQRAVTHPTLTAVADGALSVALGAEPGLHLFRIAQEAVSNALRHAGANHIRVTLSVTPQDTVRLTVEDDGVFQPASTTRRGHGLTNMRTRAREIGAAIDINGLPTGTSVVVVLPLSGDRA